MNYIKDLKYSFFSMQCLATIKSKKITIPYIVFFLFFTVYLFNPYINNSADFIVTSGNLVAVSCIFTFVWGIWIHINFMKQLNGEIFSTLGYSKREVLNVFLVGLIFLFSISQIVILSFLIIYYYFIFGFSINMSIHVSILYFNYIYLPLFFSLISSMYIYILISEERFIKKIIYILLFIIPFLAFLKKDINVTSLFYSTEKHFYNPFTGIVMYNSSIVFKLTIIGVLLSFLFLIVRFVKKKWLIHSTLIILASFICLLVTNFATKNYQDIYREDFVKTLELVNNPHHDNGVKKEQNYTVEKYDVAIKDNKPIEFNVKVSITDITSKTIKVYLNETFKVKNITSEKGKELSFVQEDSEIVVNLNSIDDQSLLFTYQGIGTALNPVNFEYVFLPYFFNWLPSNQTSTEYIFNNNSLDYRPYGYTCPEIENIESDIGKIIIQGVEDRKCISLIKGDFIKKNSSNTHYYIPKAWSGNMEGIDKYEEMKSKLVLLFNKMFDKNIKITPNSVVILPRFEDSPSENMNDIWLSNDHEIYLLNPFLNVDERSLFEQLYKETIAFYPFALIRENVTDENFDEAKLFSALFSIHFMESVNLRQIDNDALLEIYSLFPKEVIEFSKLEKEDRESKLIELYQIIISG